MKKILCLLLSLMMAVCACAGALAESVTAAGSAAGFGGEVTVELSADEAGVIQSVAVSGENETPALGGAAIEKFNAELPGALCGLNAADVSAEAVDGVSGATVTSDAVKLALAEALSQLKGGEAAQATLPDGEYHGQAQGFALGKKVGVTVTVRDGWVSEIAYDENGETAAIWNYAVQVGQEIIDNRSLAVDAIAGATVSSNAIKAAVANALTAQAGAALETLYTPVAKSERSVTLGSREDPYNVLVVGFGGSGAAAAVSAIEHTDKVIAIELNAKVGGNTSTASGPMGVNPPSKVKTNGGLDFENAEDLEQDWLAYTIDSNGEQDANPQIVHNLITEGGYVNDWLERNGFVLGAPTSFLTRFAVSQSFADYALDHVAVQQHFEDMADKFVARGGELLLNTKGEGFLFDEAGNIIGVTAECGDGTHYEIYAKSVILATGGFGGSAEMMQEYLGGVYNVYGMTNCDGAMMKAAIEAGADTQNIGMPPMSHFSAPAVILTSFDDAAYTAPGLEGMYSPNDIIDAILLDGRGMDVTVNGERFYNEATVDMESWTAGANFYTIINQNLVDDMKQNGLPKTFSTILTFRNQGSIQAGEPLTMTEDVLAAAMEAGEAWKADTIEELAAQLNMSAETLAATLQTYNGYCAAGEDPDFGKDASMLVDLSEGPYYAVKGAAWIYSTVGGLRVDEKMRVVDTDGQVMNGLYAVGTDSMGVLMSEEKFYLGYGGVAMGYVFYSGYEAGKQASYYAEGAEPADETQAVLEAVAATGTFGALPYTAMLNAGVSVKKTGENKFEVNGTAAAVSALTGEKANYVAVLLDRPEGAADCAKVSSANALGEEIDSCLYEQTEAGVVCLQPVTEEILATGGFVLTAQWGDEETAYTFCAGTLALEDLDCTLTEEAKAAGVEGEFELYAEGGFRYTLEGGASALYLQSPAPETAFAEAVIVSVNGEEAGETVEQPGAGVVCAAELTGASEVIVVVDWNFFVPKLVVWTMTVSDVPYTNTVTYTFQIR